MKKLLVFGLLFLLSFSVPLLAEEVSASFTLDQLFTNLEMSLALADEKLCSTVTELEEAKRQLEISNNLLVEVQRLSEERSLQYQRLEDKYERLLKRSERLERWSKVVMIGEGGVIVVLLLVLLL